MNITQLLATTLVLTATASLAADTIHYSIDNNALFKKEPLKKESSQSVHTTVDSADNQSATGQMDIMNVDNLNVDNLPPPPMHKIVAFDLSEFNITPSNRSRRQDDETQPVAAPSGSSSAETTAPSEAEPSEAEDKPVLEAMLEMPDDNNPITLLLQSPKVEWQGLINPLHSRDELHDFYKAMHYRLLWTENGKVTPLAEKIIKATQQAKYHALKNSTYHTLATSSLKAGQHIVEKFKFDVVLSDAFITLKKHLTNGIVNPKKQFSTWNTEPRSIDFVNQYMTVKSTNDAASLLSVDDVGYSTLQKAYQDALQSTETAVETPKIPTHTTLRPNTSSAAVRLLRQRLGFKDDSMLYDKELRQAVTDYQKNNGLKADGIAGKKTLTYLNGDNQADNLQKLAINMERYRWSYVPKNQDYVWVNIPAYRMAVKNNNHSIFDSKVIVGRANRPTPIFSDMMENIVLAPYWNVPKTIFNEDKLPRLKRNPNALGGNMQVINTATGKVVNAASVDWANGGKGYRLRQKPGASNALGRMKFLFPNRHAIYLHDTPKRKLFKRAKRALSSGCIRVERAEDLAVFFLQHKGYDRARIRKESRRKGEKWVALDENNRYPVFLNYYTAWADDDNKVHYSQDIYGYDKTMKKLYQDALKSL